MSAAGPVNVIATATCLQRPVCEFCGRVGRAAQPGPGGRLTVLDVAAGWSCVPYPEGFRHADGSTGTRWTCPPCQRRLDAGACLWTRSEVRS